MEQDRTGTRTMGSTGSFGGASATDTQLGTPVADGSQADEVKARVKDAAHTAKERATVRLEERVAAQKGRATNQLSDLSRSLRMASDNMPSENGVGRYMGLAATQVDNLASFLDNADVAELVDDVESFARRQPAAFLGGAFALGVLGARFLKSSRRNIRDDRFDSYSGYDDSRYGHGGDLSRGSFGTSGESSAFGDDDFRRGPSAFGGSDISDSRPSQATERFGSNEQRGDFR